MNIRLKSLGFVCLFLCLTGCDRPPEEPTTIALNPWPGYEYLYLAEQKGFFKEVGANIKLIQVDSLGDAQRAYINGRVDGFASTLIEVVQAAHLGGKPLSVILITDYSNGGDVIVGKNSIVDIKGLAGKRVGGEVSSLGIYVLQKALAQQDMTLGDVELLNVEQAMGKSMLVNNGIDAFVSYPPYSLEILKEEGFHTLFTSAAIPFEVVDTLSISKGVLAEQPKLVGQIHRAWQMALDFSVSDPEEAFTIMAQREGISVEEFTAVTGDLVILEANQQLQLLNSERLVNSITSVCETLVHIGSLDVQCSGLDSLIYRDKPN